MTDAVRFGRYTSAMPEQLEFGAWGVLETGAALDVFAAAHAYFDDEKTIKAEADRVTVINAARRYYDGNHVKPLLVKPGEPDDNVLINLCRSLIEDSVSWLFGNPLTGVLKMDEEGMEGEQGSSKTGDILGKFYEDSGDFHFFKRLGIRGAISGHAFIKLIFDNKINGPKAVVLDPTLCAVQTSPDDVTRPVAYRIEWRRQETDPNTRRSDWYIYRQLVCEAADGAWVVADFKCKERKKREWMIVNGPWAWPWQGWGPIHDCPNIEAGWGYYGLSELEDAAGINDAVNFLTSNTMRILKIHAHPKTVGTGVGADELKETAIDSFWTIENPDAKIYNLEMQSDLASSLALLDFLKTAFWTIGRGMDPSTYKDKIGQITNFALRVLAIRSLHKMGDKRLSYGKMLRSLNAHALEMMGKGEGVNTVVRWPDALPEDPDSMLKRLETEIAIGVVSKETAAGELGRPWEVERQRIADERKESLSIGEMIVHEFDRGGGPYGPNSSQDKFTASRKKAGANEEK